MMFGKRDATGEDGLTDGQRRVAQEWGYVLAELTKLAPLVEKGDCETLAWRAETLENRARQLLQSAQAVSPRTPDPDPGAMLSAIEPDVLHSPVGRALHPRG